MGLSVHDVPVIAVVSVFSCRELLPAADRFLVQPGQDPIHSGQ